jgi:hypothetical protein
MDFRTVRSGSLEVEYSMVKGKSTNVVVKAGNLTFFIEPPPTAVLVPG